MAEFDHTYLAQLVEQAQSGSSKAFAELYAATYQRQYRFAYCFLKNEAFAKDAVQETYITALKNIDRLNNPKSFISWLDQISFKVCCKAGNEQSYSEMEMNTISIDDHDYLLKQILNLPLSESVAISFRYACEMSIGEIAKMMDTRRSSVNRYIRTGKERLNKLLQR